MEPRNQEGPETKNIAEHEAEVLRRFGEMKKVEKDEYGIIKKYAGIGIVHITIGNLEVLAKLSELGQIMFY